MFLLYLYCRSDKVERTNEGAVSWSLDGEGHHFRPPRLHCKYQPKDDVSVCLL